MRRPLLIAVFALLLFLDLSLVPMALLMMLLGGFLGSVRHGFWISLVLFPGALAGVLIWLTTIAAKALRANRSASPN